MAFSAIMERSARHRAGSAAGGTAMASRQAHGGLGRTQLSGIPIRRAAAEFFPGAAVGGGRREKK